MSENTTHHIPVWKVALVFLLLAGAFLAVWLTGYLPRKDRQQAAVEAANEVQREIPVVTAAAVVPAPADAALTLPGSISATAEASIYARATGYVLKRMADIGDHVKISQILAVLDTPDLDQQVSQGRAALAQARQLVAQTQAALVQAEAQRDFARLTFERLDNLLKKGAIARQDADQQETALKSAVAVVDAQKASLSAGEENVRQAEANLSRLETLQDYKNVRSPVDGVVTARNIDTGYLISSTGAAQGGSPLDLPGSASGAPSAAGNELYRVAQSGMLRILVSVPQANSTDIMIGMPARIAVNEFPGRVFTGKVTRMATTLDPNSRTMQAQIDIPNPDGRLLPGMYAEVSIQIHREKPPMMIPGDAVVAGRDGNRVAVLVDDPGGNETKRVHLLAVQVGRDYGQKIEIISGLEGAETVVVNPGDDVREGKRVKAEVRGK